MSMNTDKKIKVIIDTDIGDDIDDALALYVAMREEIEIVGITTVFRTTEQRARQAKKLLCDYANGYENVPVFAGYGTPISVGVSDEPSIPYDTPDPEDPRYTPDGCTPEDAVDFIIDACYRYGEELTLLAIGPFTNVAKVIQKDANALNRIQKVVIMGGAYYKQYADWNVLCDVEAADIMFRGIDRLECIGADVTHQAVAEDALYNNLFHYQGSEPAHAYLTELCRLWEVTHPHTKPVLHDPLAVFYTKYPSVCTMQSASVVVLTEGYARAITLNVDAYSKKKYHPEDYADLNEHRRALVAKEVDLPVFHAHLLRIFTI
ncbi:MAG: nucleoside hydrolase [Ruminococcaceae bacterium]|nr:nucleoside hydrolase [Oscillospiraceae bacterium]